MKKFLSILLCFLTASLVACSDNSRHLSIPPQHWKEADIQIETHPDPPLAGMSEIVVIVTGPHGRPVQDMTVSLRGNDSVQWVQAIQDGNIGVYRRAIDIGEGESVALQVQLQQRGDKKVLLFPLRLAKS
ncbi:hypothetical protein GALL_65660 [mine drainage metagenome]|uniref:Lipoprotein n=1 Tax=mine drainage metagenome TaxID=410659 RepID=A0A1J5TI70_9ZZZZ